MTEPRSRGVGWPARLLLVAAVLGAGYWVLRQSGEPSRAATAAPGHRTAPAVPVVAVKARRGDLPVYLNGLGTVTAFNTVTVRSRVDGELVDVRFQEGQVVHQGDPLVEVDPRPFQTQLTQAEGQLVRDLAQLKEARINLSRYRDLLQRQFVSRQQYDDQAALVGQYEGAVKMDHGLIDNARLQLTYCHITAPIGGRVGLRLVDVGNVVHATDQNGLLVITQVQPIAVVFTIPEDNLHAVLVKLHGGERLPVEAYDRSGRAKIATGVLLATDNQIDQSTGTTRLKALFDNQDNGLFPNQFVNVRLLLDIQKEAIVLPTAAVQRGPQGTYVYAVRADHTVEARPVALGPTTGSETAITSGVAEGELVVTDGVDKLRPGARVQFRGAGSTAAAAAPRA